MRRLAFQVRRFPDLDIRPLETQGLDARDAAFAHALEDVILRRWLTITAILDGACLRKPFIDLETKVRSALLVGAAQLLFFDKAPAYAAINESVDWVKAAVRPGAGGLVNASLRSLTELIAQDDSGVRITREQWTDKRDELPMEDGSAIVLTREALPQDPLERLEAATSHPRELLRAWTKSMSMREARRLALHGLARPPVILNTAHLQAPLEDDPDGAFRFTQHMAPGHHVFEGPHETLVKLLRTRRDVWVQDPASSLAVMAVADLSPPLILDICAGRGTKTRQLEHTFPNAQIVATDIDPPRHRTLEESFRGHERVRIIPFRDLDEWAGKADMVLIDAPCSNTGVLARRIEARYRVSEEKTRELVAMQRQIIADSVRLLHPGGAGRSRGTILYSTCSLDPRENQEQAEWASRWHGISVSRSETRPPGGGPGEPPERYSDGSFAALLS
ncbi:MAG: hypothetical protein EA376_03955 [Phycisphaeraceae bacterium]|nr:MAG: hypothetical protein EA376_03955 [Phycisphaeraceae bacterium]